MKERFPYCITKSLQFFVFFILVLTGCAKTYKVPSNPVIGLSQNEKIVLELELYLSEALRNTKWESSVGFTSEIFFGEALSHNAERIARELFTKVIVTHDENKSDKVLANATLAPRVISIDMPWVRGTWNDTIITAILEWTLKDSKGNIIWIDTIKGEGHATGGSKVEPTSIRVKALMEDVFQKSFKAISSSPEIREFAERLARARQARQSATPLARLELVSLLDTAP